VIFEILGHRQHCAGGAHFLKLSTSAALNLAASLELRWWHKHEREIPVDKLIMIVLLVMTLLSTAMVMLKGSEATREKVAVAMIGAVITGLLVLAVFVAFNGWALFG
jgi:uncharacterized membrane protein YkvI